MAPSMVVRFPAIYPMHTSTRPMRLCDAILPHATLNLSYTPRSSRPPDPDMYRRSAAPNEASPAIPSECG